jgi:hypothetical protein
MKRKIAKRPALGRKEKVLTEAQLKKIAAGTMWPVVFKRDESETPRQRDDGSPWLF